MAASSQEGPGLALGVGVLPFMALGWLCVGAIAAGFLRTRRPAAFKTLGRVFMPAGR